MPNDNSHPMDLNPGTTLVIGMFRPVGGIENFREVLEDTLENGTRQISAHVTKIVENEEERDEAERIAQKARDIVRNRCTKTLLGFLTDAQCMPELDAEIDSIRAMASTFNRSARTCQVDISYLSIPISLALGAGAARALADHVRNELTKLRDALKEGRMDSGENNVRAILHRTKNLHELAVGVQADSIQFAIEEAKIARNTIKEAGKATGETSESAGRYVDLSMLESAIATFTYVRQSDPETLGMQAAV